MLDSLFESRSDARPAWRPGVFAAALGCHLGLLAIVFLTGGTPAEPGSELDPKATFLHFMPPPPPPAAAAPGPAPQSAPHSGRQKVQDSVPDPIEVPGALDLVQPQTSPQSIPVPEDESQPPSTPSDSEQPQRTPTSSDSKASPEASAGAPGGIAGGIPEGQPGGVAGGSPDGVPGGVIGGVPGGVLGGVIGGDPHAKGPWWPGGNVSAPVVLQRAQPEYPAPALQAHLEGAVKLRAVIHRDGTISEITVIQGLGLGCTQAAIEALKQWRFRPGRRNGIPVDTFFELTVDFTLS